MAVELVFSKFSRQGLDVRAPLSILHGIFGSKLNWRSIGKKLMVETNRPVYCIDARNHGNSPHTPEISYELMSDDVAQFLKAQNISKTVMIGHSMGGKTAMTLALTRPSLVDCLVVVDVAPVGRQSSGTTDVIKSINIMKGLDLSSIRNRRDADELLKNQIPDTILRGFLVSGLEINGSTGLVNWKTNLQAIENNMDRLSDFPQFDSEHHQYTGPTLFIGGSKSPYISQEVLPVIKQLFPNASVSHIQGAGHWPHFDKPNEFKEVINQFLSKN